MDRDGATHSLYETALRAIGRHLDFAPAYHVSVVEGTDGFWVRWHAALHHTAADTAYFPWQKLGDLDIFNSARRNTPRRGRKHDGMCSAFPGGHENALRALGFVFDAKRASNVSLDEVPDGVAVSYQTVSAEGKAMKIHAVFDLGDMETLCEQARERRRVRPGARTA